MVSEVEIALSWCTTRHWSWNFVSWYKLCVIVSNTYTLWTMNCETWFLIWNVLSINGCHGLRKFIVICYVLTIVPYSRFWNFNCAPLSDILSDSLFMLSQVRKGEGCRVRDLEVVFWFWLWVYSRYTPVISFWCNFVSIYMMYGHWAVCIKKHFEL